MTSTELLLWVLGTLSALAGAVTGFAPSKLNEWIKNRERHKRIIRNLIAELTEIHQYLSGLKVLKAREEGFFEIRDRPLPTEVYSSVKAELIEIIKEKSLLNLHQCYADIGKINRSPTHTFNEQFILDLMKVDRLKDKKSNNAAKEHNIILSPTPYEVKLADVLFVALRKHLIMFKELTERARVVFRFFGACDEFN